MSKEEITELEAGAKIDILKHLHEQQRAQLQGRRTREFQVFT